MDIKKYHIRTGEKYTVSKGLPLGGDLLVDNKGTEVSSILCRILAQVVLTDNITLFSTEL